MFLDRGMELLYFWMGHDFCLKMSAQPKQFSEFLTNQKRLAERIIKQNLKWKILCIIQNIRYTSSFTF